MSHPALASAAPPRSSGPVCGSAPSPAATRNTEKTEPLGECGPSRSTAGHAGAPRGIWHNGGAPTLVPAVPCEHTAAQPSALSALGPAAALNPGLHAPCESKQDMRRMSAPVGQGMSPRKTTTGARVPTCPAIAILLHKSCWLYRHIDPTVQRQTRSCRWRPRSTSPAQTVRHRSRFASRQATVLTLRQSLLSPER